MITKATKYGVGYETPIGLEEDSYYEMMYDLIEYIKGKGLTVRQAQKLFIDCADMVLDIKPNEKCDYNKDLVYLITNLNEVIQKGIDVYIRNWKI